MKNPDSHFFLYAKHHYKETNVISDLRKLMAAYCGIDIEHIQEADIIRHLIDITAPILRSQVSDYEFKEFILDISTNKNDWKFVRGEIDSDLTSQGMQISESKRIICRLLSVMAHTKVREGDKILLELDKPDFNILPRNTSASQFAHE